MAGGDSEQLDLLKADWVEVQQIVDRSEQAKLSRIRFRTRIPRDSELLQEHQRGLSVLNI